MPGGYGEKKEALFRIFQILMEKTDENHPLSQKKVEELLDKEYGIVIERKAVARHLNDLLQMTAVGMAEQLERGPKGWYMKRRVFEDTELRMLIDMVLSCRCFDEKRSKELYEKLISQGSPTIKDSTKYVYSLEKGNKTENQTVEANVSVIDEAIRENRKIQFDYMAYGADRKLHKRSDHCVSPYHMVFRNQNYYLVAFHEKWGNFGYFQMDHIHNIALLDEPRTPMDNDPRLKQAVSLSVISKERPYMYTDDPERVHCRVDAAIIDPVICQFGTDIHVLETNDPNVLDVSMKTSLMAMKYWALQYLDHVEVLEPEGLREEIRKSVEGDAGKYTG